MDEVAAPTATICRAELYNACVVVRRSDGPETHMLDSDADVQQVFDCLLRLLTPRNCQRTIIIELRQVNYQGYPYTSSKRLPDGAYRVNLDISDARLYCQLVFQFAHEYGHVLCYPDAPKLEWRTSNQWVEEAICHALSLYALRRFDATLVGRMYGGQETVMRDYADGEAGGALPRTAELWRWYREHRAQLRDWERCNTAAAREMQCVLSNWLLDNVPMPRLLNTLCYINSGGDGRPKHDRRPLHAYLRQWMLACGADRSARHTVKQLFKAFYSPAHVRKKRKKAAVC